VLYDWTSKYVKGAAEAKPHAAAAVLSRDHRPDCEQLVLAMIVNQTVPFSYELFDGTALCSTIRSDTVNGGA